MPQKVGYSQNVSALHEDSNRKIDRITPIEKSSSNSHLDITYRQIDYDDYEQTETGRERQVRNRIFIHNFNK